MSTDTTPRNGSPRPELSRKTHPGGRPTTFARDESGRSGLNHEPSAVKGSVTLRRSWDGVLDRVTGWVLDHIHRPRMFAHQPPSWDEVSAYGQNNALVRHRLLKKALLVWTYTVAFHAYWSAALRLYVRARPLRALVVYGLALLFTWHTPVGRWLGHHVEVIGVFLLTHLLP